MLLKRELSGLNLLVVFLAGKMLIASLAAAEDPPSIEEFNFKKDIQRIDFLAAFNGKEGFSYSLASSSPETMFSPKSTIGTIIGSGASNAGESWFVAPGGAALGEIHEFTLNVWNDNGASPARRIRLKVVASASEGAGGVEYTDIVFSDGFESGDTSAWTGDS